jgi:hypothetical protein
MTYTAMSKRPARPNPAALQRQCDDWNAHYPIGQAVTLQKDKFSASDIREGVSTVTRSKAEVLSGHSAVIWLEGISGCYLLDRVTPVTGGSP